jgi:hypothetical protein
MVPDKYFLLIRDDGLVSQIPEEAFEYFLG